MKRCPKCQRGYGDEIYYCLSDGAYLSPESTDETPPTIRLPETPPAVKTGHAARISVVVISAAVALIIGVAIIALILNRPGRSANSSSPASTSSSATPTPNSTPTYSPTPASSPSKPGEGSNAVIAYRGDDGVNVRSGPSQTAKILTVVYYNERVTVLKYADDWTEVRTTGGIVGYLRSKFLTVSGE
jgi:hypothetical protein